MMVLDEVTKDAPLLQDLENRYLHVTLLNPPDKPIFERGSFTGANAKAKAKGGQLPLTTNTYTTLFLYNDKGFLSSKIKRIVQLRQFHLRKNSRQS
jgi:hypothetical protein